MTDLTGIKCLAFDCFGTVFDMSSIPREEIKAYVEHVRKEDFTPHEFPEAWWDLKAHPDAAEGLERLGDAGFYNVALSNGNAMLLTELARNEDLRFNWIVDLVDHRAYKPNNLDAYRAVEVDTGFKPSETLMVTANPTFGDVESSAKIGMRSIVIRHGRPNTIVELAEMLEGK